MAKIEIESADHDTQQPMIMMIMDTITARTAYHSHITGYD